MALNIQHLIPGRRYAFTAIVNQTGIGKRTERPTRMLFEVVSGDVHEQHTWITYDNDVRLFAHRAFGDIISFTAEAYIYDGEKVGIHKLESVKHLGTTSMEKIHEMCLVKDGGKSARQHPADRCTTCANKIARNAKMYFGFARKGTEMHFDSEKCRDAYMAKVFG